MGSFSEDFSSLEKKIQHLIKTKRSQESELKQLKAELEKTKVFSNEQVEENKKLKERIKILLIADGTSEGGKREIKLKINEIVREVDKCIAQLNQ